MSTNSVSYVSGTASILRSPVITSLNPTDLVQPEIGEQDSLDSYLSSYSLVAGQELSATPRTANIRTVVAAPKTAEGGDLRTLLESEPGVLLLAECREAGLEAIIARHNPDLVVLDFRAESASASDWMNGDLHNDDLQEHRPLVLCVASSAHYAARAFAVRALDFLARPLDPVHFHQAMERVRRESCNRQHSRLAQQLVGLLQQRRILERPEQLVFRVDGRLVFVDLNDIDWIGASANYVRLNAGAESYLVRESIGQLSGRLDRERFVRIHRSVIVNVRRIKELQSCNAGEYIAVLKNGKKLPCSRGYRAELERYISRCIRTANAGH